jgi:hypothetical protein
MHPPTHEAGRSQSHRFTRLVIGGIAIGIEAISKRLDEWEGKTERVDTGVEPGREPTEQSTTSEILQPEREEAQWESARYAVIGMIFDAQDRLSAGLKKADEIASKARTDTEPYWRPITNSRLFAPVASRWGQLVQRGEKQVDSWIERGRIEQAASQSMAENAVNDTTEEVIDALAVHPAVRELVEKQSEGFASEFVEELRERTVSIDTLLEKIVRATLKRTPRSQLPPPDSLNLTQVKKTANTRRPDLP